jgi:carbon-monoxide dehydrogenase large subunit
LLLEKALAFVDHRELQAQIANRRAQGQLVGFGLGFFIEKSGLGPFDGVRICLQPNGMIEVVTGAASLGQGVETVVAQICGDVLSLPMRRFKVTHGQTDRISDGMGAFASRVTVMTGNAAHIAASDFKAKLLAAAATVLQAEAEDLAIGDGIIGVRDARGPSIELAALAAMSGALEAEAWFRVSHMCYPYGIHAALVVVDPETGSVKVEKLLVGYDVGRAINPTLVQGQLVGGAAQGLGGALFEEFVFDDGGQPLAASFADYLIPTAREMPPVAIQLTEDAPSPINPLGVKGAGEGGITAVGAAIANAVDDALGRPGADAIDRLPLTPARVLSIVKRLRR